MAWEDMFGPGHQEAVDDVLGDDDEPYDEQDDDAEFTVDETTMEEFTDDAVSYGRSSASSSSSSAAARRRKQRQATSSSSSAAAAAGHSPASDGDASDGDHGRDRQQDRRERNKASAKASRRKRKAHLETLADTVTRLAEETDRERLVRVESAAVAVEQRRAELVAAARAALAMAASGTDGGPAELARGLSGGSASTPSSASAGTPTARGRGSSSSNSSGNARLQTAAAAAAALPGLLRERFSMAGTERRALLDFAFEHAAATGLPHHLRPLLFLAEQEAPFFADAKRRMERAKASSAPLDSVDPAFELEWGIRSDPAAAASTAGSSRTAATTMEPPNLWHLLRHELQLTTHSQGALQSVLSVSHADEFATLHRFIVTNRALRAATAERAEAAAALSASLHGCLSPAQELAFQDFLSRNAERIRRLMPSGSRSRSTDAQAAAAARVAQAQARGSSTGSLEEELEAAKAVARHAASPQYA